MEEKFQKYIDLNAINKELLRFAGGAIHEHSYV